MSSRAIGTLATSVYDPAAPIGRRNLRRPDMSGYTARDRSAGLLAVVSAA